MKRAEGRKGRVERAEGHKGWLKRAEGCKISGAGCSAPLFWSSWNTVLMTDSTSDTESDSDTQSNPPTQTTTGNNDKPYVTFKDKQKRKAVYGEARASKDRVTFDVPWPHEYAQTKSINFQNIDFDLVQLIRGEVSIIHSVEKSSTSVLR